MPFVRSETEGAVEFNNAEYSHPVRSLTISRDGSISILISNRFSNNQDIISNILDIKFAVFNDPALSGFGSRQISEVEVMLISKPFYPLLIFDLLLEKVNIYIMLEPEDIAFLRAKALANITVANQSREKLQLGLVGTIGILYGDSNNLFLSQAALKLGINCNILDPNGLQCFAAKANSSILTGDPKLAEDLMSFAGKVDVITYSSGDSNQYALDGIDKNGLAYVFPSPNIVRILQTPILREKFFDRNEIPCIKKGRPVLKVRYFSVVVVICESQIELYPVSQSIYIGSDLYMIETPAMIPKILQMQIENFVRDISNKLQACNWGAGVLTIHIDEDVAGNLLVSKIIPRVCTSGNYTLDACCSSQYENHLRAVLSLPLGGTDLIVSHVVMVLLLNPSKQFSKEIEELKYKALEQGLSLYVNTDVKDIDKSGFVNIMASTRAEMLRKLRDFAPRLAELLPNQNVKFHDRKSNPAPEIINLGSFFEGSDVAELEPMPAQLQAPVPRPMLSALGVANYRSPIQSTVHFADEETPPSSVTPVPTLPGAQPGS
jgi:phosphoribosylaminoimidazole carboxylase (NCAIR synthetase)